MLRQFFVEKAPDVKLVQSKQFSAWNGNFFLDYGCIGDGYAGSGIRKTLVE